MPGTVISSAAVNSDLSDIAAALTASIAADGQTPVTAAIGFFAGTATDPGITFTSDDSTGFWLVAAGKVAAAGGGIGTVLFDSTDTAGNYLKYVNGSVIQPIGIVDSFAGSSAPTGWLLCFGQAVSRTTYAGLFAAISTTYGSGDGSTTFNLPDCRGRYIAGKDDMGGSAASRITVAGGNFDGAVLGQTGGQQNRTLIQDNLPDVTFTVNVVDPGHVHTQNALTVYNDGVPFLNVTASGVNGSNNSKTTVSATTSITASAPSGGADASFATLPPTIVMNTIIFTSVV